MHIEIKAYAKINLYLDIVNKQSNGFHDVESVMQTISLADDLVIDVMGADATEINVTCDSTYAPNGKDNLVYRAAELYLKRANVNANVDIKLTKNIPSPAGMGGGSADAATVLRGLNDIYKAFSVSELENLAAELGSDVPFCVRGGTQIAKGRGEKLYPCKAIPNCYIVVACGGEGLSTPLAYRMLDEQFDDFKSSCGMSDKLVEFERSTGDLSQMCLGLYNIFESVAATKCPDMQKLKNKLAELGAIGALMCGSGPAVFGIFDEEDSAQRAAADIQQNGYFASLCTPIQKLI